MRANKKLKKSVEAVTSRRRELFRNDAASVVSFNSSPDDMDFQLNETQNEHFADGANFEIGDERCNVDGAEDGFTVDDNNEGDGVDDEGSNSNGDDDSDTHDEGEVEVEVGAAAAAADDNNNAGADSNICKNIDENGNDIDIDIEELPTDVSSDDECDSKTVLAIQTRYKYNQKSFERELAAMKIENDELNRINKKCNEDQIRLERELENEISIRNQMGENFKKMESYLVKVNSFFEKSISKYKEKKKEHNETNEKLKKLLTKYAEFERNGEKLYEKCKLNMETTEQKCMQNKQLQNDLKELCEKHQLTTEKLIESEKILNSLRVEIVEVKFKFDDLLKVYNDCRTSNANKIEQLDLELMKSHNILRNYEVEKSRLEEHISKLSNSMNEMQEENKKLLNQIDVFEEDKNRQNEEKLLVRNQIEKLENDLIEANKQLDQMKIDFEQSRLRLVEMDEKVDNCENAKLQLVDKHTWETSQLKNSIENLEICLADEQMCLKIKCEEFDKQLRDLQNESNDARDRLEQCYLQKINELQNQKQCEIDNLQNKLAKEENLRKTIEEKFEKELFDLKNEYDNFKHNANVQNSQLQLKLSENSEKFSEEKNKLKEAHKKELNEIHQKLEELQNKNSFLEKRIIDAEAEKSEIYSDHQININELRNKIQHLESINENLKQQFEQELLQLKNESLKNFAEKNEIISDKENIISELKMKIDETVRGNEIAKADFNQKLAYFENELNCKQSELNMVNNSMTELREAHSKQLEMLNDDKNGFIEEQIKLRHAAEQKLSEMVRDFSEKLQKSEQQNRVYENEVNHLKLTKDELFNKMNINFGVMREDFKRKLDEKNEVCNQQKMLVSEQSEKCKKLEKLNCSLKSELQSLVLNASSKEKETEKVIENLNLNLKNGHDECSNLRSKLQILEKQKKCLKNELESEKSKEKQYLLVNQENVSLKTEIENIKKDINVKLTDLNYWKSNCDVLNAEMEKLQKQLNNEKNVIENYKQEAAAIVEKQEQSMSELEEKYRHEITELKDTIDLKYCELEELKLNHSIEMKQLEDRLKKEKALEIERFMQAIQTKHAETTASTVAAITVVETSPDNEQQKIGVTKAENSIRARSKTTRTQEPKVRPFDKRFKTLK